MKIKQLEQFYKDNDLKVEFDEDGMPIMNGIDCMCSQAKCKDNYSCHDGTPCEYFKPNKRFEIWKQKGDKSASEVDWDKDYIKETSKTDIEKRVERLEARIEALEK